MKFPSLLTVVFLFLILVAATPATSAFLVEQHSKKGITCERCHGDKPKEQRVPMETCLGCHGSYQKLAEATKEKSPNPHESHIGEIRCTLCHHVHKDSEFYCNTCHQFDVKFPK